MLFASHGTSVGRVVKCSHGYSWAFENKNMWDANRRYATYPIDLIFFHYSFDYNYLNTALQIKVAINCKFTGRYVSKGTECTNPILGGIEEPFCIAVSPPGESCGTRPINITLTYKICNENTSGNLILNQSVMSDVLNITFISNVTRIDSPQTQMGSMHSLFSGRPQEKSLGFQIYRLMLLAKPVV